MPTRDKNILLLLLFMYFIVQTNSHYLHYFTKSTLDYVLSLFLICPHWKFK